MENEIGTCDTCNTEYPTYSRDGRCGDCGECADHCTHPGGALLNQAQFLNNLSMAQFLAHHDEEWKLTNQKLTELLNHIDELREKK